MQYISLDEALHAIAARIGLPEALGDEPRIYERAGVVVEYEQKYLYACRYSFAAAVLHQCITNSTAPLRWWSMHPDTGMAVIGDSVDEEGLAILLRFARLIRREQGSAIDNLDVDAGLFLGEDGLPQREPRTIDLAELFSGMGGLYWFQSVGLVASDLVRLLDDNRIGHNLKPQAEPVPINSSTPCNPPQPARPEDTSRNRAQLQAVPVAAGSASGGVKPAEGGPGWSLKSSLERAPGYRWPLYQVLKAAHIAGQPRPKARDVLNIWELKPPPDVQVMPDGVKYNDGLGNPKEANLKAIQQAIKGLLK